MVQSRQQSVHLSHRVVCREAGPSGRRHLHPSVQRPSTVMAHPHGHPRIVEDLTHIVRVDPLDDERNHSRTVPTVDRPDHTDPATLRKTGEKRLREGFLMGGHPMHAEVAEVVARGGQADGLAAACDYLSDLGMHRVTAHEEALTEALLAGLAQRRWVRAVSYTHLRAHE